MMDKRSLAYALCALALLPVCAAGAVYPFGDTSPSWGANFDGKDFDGTAYGGTGFKAWAPSPDTPDVALPTVDENGDPILDSQAGKHEAVVNGGKLKSITIRYRRGGDGDWWGTLKPGDLFLDTDGQYGFDYVARTPYFADGQYFDTNGTPNDNNSSGFSDSWTLYELNNLPYKEDLGDDGGPYQLANDSTPANDQATWVNNYWVRNYHPWALADEYVSGTGSYSSELPDIGSDIGTVSFSGWTNLGNSSSNTTGASTWRFDDGEISLESPDLTIGWTVNCANDVLLTQVPDVHLPEPASLAVWTLLGLGVVGFGTVRRRNHRKE